ncbi:asparaginase [Halococcus salifodinae]|uniref:L-asparaginase n=1 Tax=Halococcus salifodinae DSM 8989 TaxID=1227456 RepID=M0N8T3_9EURY|nr:asparaginase [Halococcus salifodinae]EMA54296.1 asparaginase/glutaminase [Halococcus salifodinae DSM 8989]
MNVTVVSTGGTIASTDDDGDVRPTKSGSDLLDAVPDVDEYATVDVEEVAQVPSFEIDTATLEAVGRRVAALDDDATVDGVVVTHGTDTMEETAYYLDVALQPETPVYLTGAQRRPDETGSDAAANLQTAFRAAAAFEAEAATGTFVVFNEEVHAAREATKSHTTKLETFRSPNTGPVATFDHAGAWVHRPPTSETDAVLATDLDATVYVLKSGIGVRGDLLDAALDRGADGVVLEATGIGNTTKEFGRAVRDATAEIPVVVASRCFAGRTTPLYGSVGGSERLAEYGAVFAGDLPAQKARIKLQLALEAYDGREAVEEVFSG